VIGVRSGLLNEHENLEQSKLTTNVSNQAYGLRIMVSSGVFNGCDREDKHGLSRFMDGLAQLTLRCAWLDTYGAGRLTWGAYGLDAFTTE
jgi:hypothetical protein